MTQAIGEAFVDLWLAFYDSLTDPRLQCWYRGMLSEAEKRQEARFHLADDRLRYLVTRALVKTTLSRYGSVDPAGWQFCRGEFGRPEICERQRVGRALTFNVSHTKGLVVLGVTAGRAIGVDVENMRSRAIALDIADTFLTGEEAHAVRAIPRPEQGTRILEYWTLKESYLKAKGLGLSVPMYAFRFAWPNEGALEFAIDPEFNDEAAGWQYWQLQVKCTFLVAVCLQRVDTTEPALTVRGVVPGYSEETLTPMILRRSKEA